jgi:Mg2+-importing ATPase
MISVPDVLLPVAKSEGLTSQEAASRLARFGPNDPAPSRKRSWVQQFLILFLNPLIVILLIAAAASALLGERVDAFIITTMVVVGVAINFVQTYRSSRAAEMLRQQVTPTATTLRDGRWQEVPRTSVVPGDLIRLSAGDMVPADARLLESRDLYAHQAALTGESMPVERNTRRHWVRPRVRSKTIWFSGEPRLSAAPRLPRLPPPGAKQRSAISPNGSPGALSKPSSNVGCVISAG